MTKIKLNVRKVAFLGSSTSSRPFAPFGKSDWEIWCTGPGGHVNPDFEHDFDRWFELHDMAENDPALGPVLDHDYFAWLVDIADRKKVYYRPPIYEGLKGIDFPWDDIRKRHCGYFLDSTVAWMMALCYDYCEVDEIGLFGIDFATDAERMKQRKGTKHFMELFRMRGVKVTVPDISEMGFDPEPYPGNSPLGKKFHAQLRFLEPQVTESETKIAQAEQLIREQREHLERIRGTMEAMMYFKDNWT
jgi:hypothetical protein